MSRLISILSGLIIVALLGAAILFKVERDSAYDEVSSLVGELAVAQAQMAAAAEAGRMAQQARDIAMAQAKRAVEENVKWEELVNELQSMEGGDAPLSDFLSRAAGRLWGP